jgi:hypothetical protein
MRRLLMTILLVLAAGPVAIAQNGTPNPSSTKQGPWPAPVGHRQPRADQVPQEKNLANPNDPVNREDAELDRKLKSICRGC